MAIDYDNDYRDSGGGFVAGLFTGMAIGAGIGLLFAPRAGSELRGQIADSATSVGKRVSETFDAVADAGRDAYQQARDVASTARDVATTAGNELGRMAGEAGRSAERGAAAIRSAARSRTGMGSTA